MGNHVTKKGKPFKLSLGSFSLIKGFAICIIVFGHISQYFEIGRLTWFYPVFAVLNYLKTSFIPLFFIISGYGFKKGLPKAILKKSAKSLIIPYLLVMAVFCMLFPLSTYFRTFDIKYSLHTMLQVFLGFLLGIPAAGKVLFGFKLSNCAIVWFLLALFWAQNILNSILKRKRIIEQIALVVGCAALGYILCIYDMDFYCIPQGLIATTYCYIGYVLKKTKLIERGLPYRWMYFAWVILSAIYARWGYFDLCYGDFAFFPIDYVGVIFLALLVLGVGLYVGRFEWKILELFKDAGTYSYWVLCLHSIEQKCLPWELFINMTREYPNEGFILALIIKVVIISCGCMIIKRIIKFTYRKKIRNYVRQKLYSGSD